MTRANSRLVVVLLLCTMATTLPGAQAWALSSRLVAAPLPAAGCHGHTPAAPAPVSYQCCVNGHHWTLPSASFSPHPLLADGSTRVDGEDLSLISSLSAHIAVTTVPASSPPGIAPLRI